MNNLHFPTKEALDQALWKIRDLIEKNGVCTVNDLCILTGQPVTYTDGQFGWTSTRYFNICDDGDHWTLIPPVSLPISILKEEAVAHGSELTWGEQIRLECIKAVCQHYAGSNYSWEVLIPQAMQFEKYVRTGNPPEE